MGDSLIHKMSEINSWAALHLYGLIQRNEKLIKSAKNILLKFQTFRALPFISGIMSRLFTFK